MLTAAWGGAVLFLAALLYFAWFYLIGLGRPVPSPPEGTGAAAAINVALFTIFALHHSLLARAGVKRRLDRILPPASERVAYVWVASLLFLGVCLLWRPLPGVAWSATGPAAWALRALQLAGAALTVASASRIDIWELAGVKARGFTARGVQGTRVQSTGGSKHEGSNHEGFKPREVLSAPSAALTISGPYRWLRHPIYLGWVLFVFGAPTMTSGRLLFASVSTAYLALAIPFEERSLTAEFGQAYRDYQRRVRWRLLPGLW